MGYEAAEVGVLAHARSVLEQVDDVTVRNKMGRTLLRELWPDELTYIQKTHWIRTKDTDSTVKRLVPRVAQDRFFRDVIVKCRQEGRPIRGIVLKARQLGFCFDPSTRVLTADLRWVPIDSLQPGDELVAVDENVPKNGAGERASRRMRTAVVEAKRSLRSAVLRVTMDDGRVLVMTAEHRMLCRMRGGTSMVWREAGKMKAGDEIRYITKPWVGPTVEDGWFAGMIDGEGSLLKVGSSPSVSVSQLRGAVWDRMVRYLAERGYHYCVEDDATPRKTKFGKKPVPRVVVGRMNELFQLIGQCRPTRFIHQRWWEGRGLPGRRTGDAVAKIISVEHLPTQRVVDIQTSTGTFVAEGFVSHNSTLIQSWQYEQCDREPARNSLTISYDDPSTQEMLRKAKFVHQRMWFPHPTKRDAEGVIEFSDNQSQFIARTAGNFSAGRGDTFHHIHCSEIPMWPDPGETLTSALQCVPTAQNTSVFYESTAKGAMGEFYDAWRAAEAGESDFVPFFAPWFWDPDYALEFPSEDHANLFGRSLTVTERRLRDDHSLTLEQLHWRRYKIRNELQGSEAKFRQEFPSTPTEAFLTSGSPVFNADAIAELEKNATPPQWRGNIILEIA